MTAVISMTGLAKTYPGPPPVPALKPADIVVRRGEYVAVVGPSGSGKSTFLNLAGLLDRPTAGRYELDGLDTGPLLDRDRTALRGRAIGFVFQAFHLLAQRTALENVALSMLYTGISRRVRRARADQTLERVGLANRAHAPAVQLSGGERQRVAIARALAGEPSLLLCDEPTGNLDTATAANLLELLDELHGDGMTLMVVTHDPTVAAHGQRTITIRDGQVAESGVTDISDVVTQEGVT